MNICDIVYWILCGTLLFCAIQAIRLIFADADLSLLWAARFGKSKKCLKGKVVWITGASGGIGEHLVYELVRAGCRLVLSARRRDELERVKRQCLLTGRIGEDDILVLPLDMLKFNTHKEAFDKVLQTFKTVDILINNAGRSQRALIRDTILQIDRDIMELNVMGTLSLTKTVLPFMMKNKKGHIVFTSSVAGKVGAPMSASYSATKFALQGWCDTARLELSSYNIDITTVCPGPVFSNVQTDAFTGKPDETYGVDMKQNERRMKTERCADLMAVAIVNRMDEVWISLQPVLLITYLSQYMPGISHRCAKVMGRHMSFLDQLRKGGPAIGPSK